MSRLKPQTAWQRIVEDSRLPAKARLMALEQIARPSLSLLRRLLAWGRQSSAEQNWLPLQFLPDPDARNPTETWWQISPTLVARFLRVLGFPTVETTFHVQKHRAGAMKLYTVVGRR